ncbi:MAG: hypothetical protein AAB383_00785 [Patescibacteria group bacterium]
MPHEEAVLLVAKDTQGKVMELLEYKDVEEELVKITLIPPHSKI